MSLTAATALKPAPDTEPTPDAASLDFSIHSDLQEAAAEWRELISSGFGNPYQSPEWLDAWIKTLGAERHVEPVVVVGRFGDKPVVVLPFGLERAAGTTSLSFLGHEHGNQNTGIWDPRFYAEVPDEQIAALLKDVCHRHQADMLVLQNVPEDWKGRKHPLVLAVATPSPSPIFVRNLSADFDTLFRDTHSKSSRKNLLRKQRHLQSVDGYKVIKAESEQDLRRALDAFLEQRSTRAREAGIPNVFSSRTARRFLEMVLGLEAGNETSAPLDLWFLEADGKIRSTYLCARHGGTVYAYSNSVAHDELLANSPGLVLIKEIIEQACADDGISVLDLGLGEERYKTAWAEPVLLKDSRLAMSFRGSIRKNAETLRLQAKTAVRNSEVLWPLVKRLRKWTSSVSQS